MHPLKDLPLHSLIFELYFLFCKGGLHSFQVVLFQSESPHLEEVRDNLKNRMKTTFPQDLTHADISFMLVGEGNNMVPD